MKFAYLIVDTLKKSSGDKYILKDYSSRVYLPLSTPGYKDSMLKPYIGEEFLAFIMSDYRGPNEFGTVITTVDGMPVLDWIDGIKNMEILDIVNNKEIVRFLDVARTHRQDGIKRTRLMLTNLKEARTRLKSIHKRTEEMKWLHDVLPVLQFLDCKYQVERY